MSGFHYPHYVSDADRAQISAIQKSVWNNYFYKDRLPERGLTIGGKPALTGTDPKQIGKYVVITVRDPLGVHGEGDHASNLAGLFGPAEKVGESGLFQVYSADMDGTKVSVVATGSGTPELELALYELMEHSDAEVFLYFGTGAGLHPYAAPGDVVISSGVVREDGLSSDYIAPCFPAAPSYEVIAALVESANGSEVKFHVGLTRSTDSDMLGNGRPSVGGYMQKHHTELIDYWVRAGVLTNDREASAVVTLGNLFGRRTGVIVGVTDNFPSEKPITVGAGMDSAARVLVGALRTLAKMDAEKAQAQSDYWSPSMHSNRKMD